jgi:hypothetical protein
LADYHYDRLWNKPPAGVIFLVRDPVKLLASFYAHLKARPFFGIRLDVNCPFKEFIEDPRVGAGRYEEYLAFYLESFRRSGVPTLIVRYEDVLANPEQGLGRMLSFSDLSLDKGATDQIVKASSFEKMREAEERNTYKVAWLAPAQKGATASMKTRGAFRQGRYVDYGDEERAVLESVLRRSPLFAAFGYSSTEVQGYQEADVYDAAASFNATQRLRS